MLRARVTAAFRGRRLVACLSAVIVAGALAGLAIASAGGAKSPSSGATHSRGATAPSSGAAAPSTLWKWPGGVVPGSPFVAPSSAVSTDVLSSASRASVAPSSLRVAAETSDGLMLVFGTNSSGTLCSADVSNDIVGGFNCLSSWSDKWALLPYATASGPQEGVIDHASVVGVARPDVARVSVTTPTGSQNLPLNEWHGFSYTASTANDRPISLTAYDASGAVLETDPVG
jgi:hypothetical protein